MRFKSKYLLLLALAGVLICQGCDSVDDNRIPNMPVNISLSDIGMWNSYGVAGFGSHRIFTLTPRQPANFPFSSKTFTGFGGVLLIEGVDPFAGNSSIPLAYDLACPYERKADTRIYIEQDSYMAVCPVCGSIYDVTMQRGAPVAGPSATGEYKYALKAYNCVATGAGGYLITN